jgi:hypothetical protein
MALAIYTANVRFAAVFKGFSVDRLTFTGASLETGTDSYRLAQQATN